MTKNFNVAIIGNGRIGQALRYYFKQYSFVSRADFLSKDSDAGRYDLLVGALPGEIGKKCLNLALKYRKNLIDISDIDPPEYLKQKSEIKKRGILVIPGCGFSPGLVNFILGRYLFKPSSVKDIEVKAGSLSPKKDFYPFLWCFEDIVVEHTIPSWQIVSGKKKKFPVFAGRRQEKYFGIEAESYYCASGFENILHKGLKSFVVRVVRPRGFRRFFSFIKSHGFIDKANIAITKNMLESRKEDNFTFAEVNITLKNAKSRWFIKSFSRKSDRLNSMQKITASFPASLGKFLLQGKIQKSGLLFVDSIAQDKQIFEALLKETIGKGVQITHG